MGFDSTWILVDLKAYRALLEPPATAGDVWRLASAGAPWASELQLPDRHDIGLLMALRDVARRDPTYQKISAYDRAVFEPGGRFAGASFFERGALQDALPTLDRERSTFMSKERKSVIKLLKVKAEGAPELLVGPRKLAAIAKLARVFDETLATDETTWAAATAYVERPVFAAFLALLRELPADRVLMAQTV